MSTMYAIPYASAFSNSTAPVAEAFGTVQIGDFSLYQDGYCVTRVSYDDQGQSDYETYKNPRTDGGGAFSRYYRGHSINIEVTVKGSTTRELQERMDALKLGVSGFETYLYATNPKDTRKIRGTVTELKFDRKGWQVTYARAKIGFETVEPFWQATDSQSLSRVGDSTGFMDDFIHPGTANALPVFYFVFGTTTATGISIVSVGEAMEIPTAINSGDIVVVDSQEKTVTKNGAGIDYTGIFPQFEPGNNAFSVSVTGVFSVDTTIVSPKTYL